MTYYNDNEPYVVQWLTNLIQGSHISPGIVDPRPIQEVSPSDVQGYKRAHFFAGIGGWDYALQLAGWPLDREVWTGSCPCQPFSVAGKRKGTADERHLWPEWLRLIKECKPATIFGEQVASKGGREWLSGVFVDLEELGYAVAGADLCAAGIGAPHIRQRLWWVAYSNGRSQGDRELQRSGEYGQQQTYSQFDWMEHPQSNRRIQWRTESGGRGVVGGCSTSGVAVPQSQQPYRPRTERFGRPEPSVSSRMGKCSSLEHFWDSYDLIPCLDNKTRRIEPGTFPLAYGVPNRVGKLRAYGNSIVPQVAATFIQAVMESLYD